MATKAKLPSMASKLESAIDNKREEEIAGLKLEIASLKENSLTVVEIPIHDITPGRNPRNILTEHSIETIANHLERNGQDHPISIYPNPTGSPKYLIKDGKRRWYGAKHLGKETILATIEAPPRDEIPAALTTFTHHEDLHPLDLAETLMSAIHVSTKLEPEEITKIISRVTMRLSRNGNISILNQLAQKNTLEQMQGLESLEISDPKERATISFLLKEGLKPSSVRANLLTMLGLPSDLTAAIKEHGINSNIALSLNSLSAKNLSADENTAKQERIGATQTAIEQKLSLRETRSLVEGIKAKYRDNPQQPITKMERFKDRIDLAIDEVIEGATVEEIKAIAEFLKGKLAAVKV
jgi:ParB family transcriptional regulator, chromosome partitioning protein